MQIITKRRLKEFAAQHTDAQASLATWVRVAASAQWSHLVEVRASWPSADQVGNLTVFNIGGNNYRLITYIDYRFRKVFIREILTHAEYDKEGWKHDAWY